MRIFGLEIRKAYDKRVNHELDDDDRNRSKENRRLAAEIKALEHEKRILKTKHEIAEMRDELEEIRGRMEDGNEDDGSDTSDAERLFMSVILPRFLGGNVTGGGGPSAPTSPLAGSPPSVTINNDDELLDMIEKIPKKYLKIAEKMPDSALFAFLKRQTAYDDPTINRVIALFRTGKHLNRDK